MNSKPPIGATPYYVNISARIQELCEAIISQTDCNKIQHNKIRLWCKEILMLNEVDRNLRYEEEQKVWAEGKDGQLREMT